MGKKKIYKKMLSILMVLSLLCTSGWSNPLTDVLAEENEVEEASEIEEVTEEAEEETA